MPAREAYELYRELVPLAEAAATAYHVITERPEPLRDRLALEEVRGLVAIALSSVATILKQEGPAAVPVEASEIQQRLFVSNGAPPRLEGLYVRRIDLLRAVELLREAHVAFGHAQVPDSIRRPS